ncbi:MAG TPA: ABC transporter ATP-binding protein [Firmicutes bacterium]|nr:ABC transporter ATP-binding protein [Bacillota bacterium]
MSIAGIQARQNRDTSRSPGETPRAGAVSPANPPVIVVEGLTKRYGNLTAVREVSFSVEQGEIFGLLGPNGAGKTTTLEIIEGLRRADAGRVTVRGIDVAVEPRRARSVMGVQLQEAGFFEKLTVTETIATFASFHRRSLPVRRLIERLQLQDKARTLVENLSGGQRQRLSVALALVNDPDIVFLDEPTTGLDPQARRNLWDIIRSIREEGRTVVLTTHYMEEAEELCDRVAIMDHGEIIALDTPARLVQTHAPGAKVFVTPGRDGMTGEMLSILSELPAAAGVDANGNGELAVHTQDLETTVAALIDWGRSGRIQYKSLRVEVSNLEDVFLKLTGRRLRE